MSGTVSLKTKSTSSRVWLMRSHEVVERTDELVAHRKHLCCVHRRRNVTYVHLSPKPLAPTNTIHTPSPCTSLVLLPNRRSWRRAWIGLHRCASRTPLRLGGKSSSISIMTMQIHQRPRSKLDGSKTGGGLLDSARRRNCSSHCHKSQDQQR